MSTFSDPDDISRYCGLPRSAINPAALDRAADAELQLGHHNAAEFLAWRAVALREART